MNITSGQSAKKEHLSNGAVTACNKRTSGPGKNDFDSFKWMAEKYPEDCCKVCLDRFNERTKKIFGQ
jgi:hypothetical protein